MNTPAKELFERLKVKTFQRNESNDDLDAAEALTYLNEATREIFRWCGLYVSWVVAKDETIKIATPSAKYFQLSEPFMFLVEVAYRRVGEKDAVLLSLRDENVRCRTFGSLGFDRIVVDGAVLQVGDELDVIFVPAEIKRLIIDPPSLPDPSTTHLSLFPQMFDDVLLQFAFVGWGLGRGMDMSPEEQSKQRWFTQIQTMLYEQAPRRAVGSYYQGFQPRGWDEL